MFWRFVKNVAGCYQSMVESRSRIEATPWNSYQRSQKGPKISWRVLHLDGMPFKTGLTGFCENYSRKRNRVPNHFETKLVRGFYYSKSHVWLLSQIRSSRFLEGSCESETENWRQENFLIPRTVDSEIQATITLHKCESWEWWCRFLFCSRTGS